jgi:hypothetical protein|tara:strand:- start:1533 stop:1799 length:267 start_codon:yes stop_codon:yes gene_type:complete
MPKSSKAEVRIVPVFRKSNLTDCEFLTDILARIMIASKGYVSKIIDKRILEAKPVDCEDEEEGDIVNVRYVIRAGDDGCAAAAEISLC